MKIAEKKYATMEEEEEVDDDHQHPRSNATVSFDEENGATPIIATTCSKDEDDDGLTRRASSFSSSSDGFESLKPSRIQRELTEISKRYDFEGKGYLSATQRELRDLDSHNKGYLEPIQVYSIIKSLHDEQKQSAQLMDEIRKEHKRSNHQRWAIVGLCAFALLLAAANVAVSFVAANLAKDTEVQTNTYDLVSQDGQERLGTTSKVVEVLMQPVDETVSNRRSRHLQQTAESFVCGPKLTTANGTTRKKCSLKGEVNHNDAVKMYRQLCPGWPNAQNVCRGGGVKEVELNCNGIASTISRSGLPSRGPVSSDGLLSFPTLNRSFPARQRLRNCVLNYDLDILCPNNNQQMPCYVMGTYDLDDPCAPPNGQELKLCGTATKLPSQFNWQW